MVQAVILAGGKGTRLAAVAGGLPKPLVPVDGVSIVERQISLLVRYGVEEIFLTTGHRAGVLFERLGDGSGLGVRLHHVVEDEPLGTAGGVAALREQLSGDFLVLYGDVLVHMDLGRLLRFHRKRGAAATIVVHPNDHPYDSDLVSLDRDGRVLEFHPKPRPSDAFDLPNMVSAALYVLCARTLAHIEDGVKQDFIVDVLPRLLRAGDPVFGYHTPEYLKDMGTPERLALVESDLREGKVEAWHWENARPMAFLDRDGVINREVNGVHRPDQLGILPGAAAAIRSLNRAGWLTGVVTNQPDVAKGFMSEEDLTRIHWRLETLLGVDGAWLDGIRCCPHHPDRGFPGERPEFKIACSCRKPATGMLEAHAERLPVDRAASVVIGDSWRDMAAAHTFGADAIGVWTGHGLSQGAPEGQELAGRPDIMLENLSQAVALLLQRDAAVDALADELDASLETSQARPLLLLVGGLSRTGKSSSVFRLRRRLRERGRKALWVRLDDWLVPVEQRSQGSTLAQRYPLEEAQRALEELAAGGSAEAPGYDPRTRTTLRCRIVYDASGIDLVIVEGVPALFLEAPAARCTRVYVEASSEQERRRRVRRFYEFKGLSPGEIDTLIADRSEEHAAISALAGTAQLRLVPELGKPETMDGVER